MSDAFKVDHRGLNQLRRFYTRMPKAFQQASASMLNHFAFGTKKEVYNVLLHRMTIRDKRFVNSKVRVVKARKSARVDKQVSITGSIASPRFTGWIEQQTGSKTDKDRTFSLAGRRGSRRRKALQKARLKPGMIKPSDYQHKDDHHRVLRMLKELSAKKSKQPFRVHGHNTMTSGVYKFKGKKLTMLQKFKANAQPDRIPWMDLARSQFFRGANMQQLWGRTISFVLKVNK
jgi:hypothetical protein